MTHNEIHFQGKSHERKYVFVTITVILIILVSCTNKQTIGASNTLTPLNSVRTKTPFTEPTFTVPPTETLVNPTKTINPNVGIVSSVIVTQVSPVISTNEPGNNKYIYKNAIVTIKLVDLSYAVAYINLDDLSNNDLSTSDLKVERSSGNEIFHMIRPINYAYFYWSKYPDVSYDDCLMHFPITESDYSKYIFQGNEFQNKGGAYCFLTNEDRIAIIKLISGSQKVYEDSSEDFSFEVTVFSSIVTNQ